jgi:outer membrane protein assembly factor BamB
MIGSHFMRTCVRVMIPALMKNTAIFLALTVPVFASAPVEREARFLRLHGAEQPARVEAPAAPGAWYGFRNGFQNRGVSPVAVRPLWASPTARQPWVHQTSGLIWGTAVVDHAGNAYVGSADKQFYSLTPAGAVRWTYRLPDAADAVIDSAATLTPYGLVVVPGGDGSLHALKMDTGERAWKFDAYHAQDHEGGVTVNSFEGNVTLGPDGLLYAGSDNGHLYCVGPDGKERWNFGTGMMIWSAVAFDPEGKWLAFGSLDGYLYVLDRATGAKIASFKAGGEFKCSPAVDARGRVYTGNADFSFRCLELGRDLFGRTRLKEVWRFATRGEIYSSAALADGRVVFGSHDGYVYCLSSEGKELWRYGVYHRISASPLVTADGVVLIGAKNGKMYALDLESGRRLWSFKSAPGLAKVNLDASPALTPDGRVLVGSYTGAIHGLPAEFAPGHPADPRVELAPGHDVPQFDADVPQSGATLRFADAAGQWPAGPVEPIGPSALLTYKIVARDTGTLIPEAAVASHGLSITVNPPDPVELVVASDGSSVTLSPGRFWRRGTKYTIRVQGRYYHRSNPFVDALKWVNLPRFDATTTFTVRDDAGALPKPTATVAPQWSIRGMYVYQPEILDTLIPAAMDGQAFLASMPWMDERTGRLVLLLLPAYPRPEGVVLRPAPEKVFALDGRFDGDHVVVAGALTMAAMGGHIPFAPLRFFGRLLPDRVEDGKIHATASLLGIKGNGSTYFGVSWSTLDDLADARLKLQALGTVRGERVPAPEHGVALAGTRWIDSRTFAADLTAPAAAADRLVTAVAIDTVAGRVVAQGSARLAAHEAGPRTVQLPLARAAATRPGVVVMVLLDGQPLAK